VKTLDLLARVFLLGSCDCASEVHAVSVSTFQLRILVVAIAVIMIGQFVGVL